ALLRLPEHVDARALAEAAAQVGAAGVREHLPGRRRPGQAAQAAAALRRLLGESVSDPEGMLAVAAVNTTVAGLPRAVAWCADDQLWSAAADPAQRAPLVNELLRVVAPSPLLPRAAAADGTITGKRVRAGDRLVLVARHAADAHRHDPDPVDPQPPQVAQVVFGAGPHACPGAGLARAQLDDVLRTLAPYRPVVVRERGCAWRPAPPPTLASTIRVRWIRSPHRWPSWCSEPVPTPVRGRGWRGRNWMTCCVRSPRTGRWWSGRARRGGRRCRAGPSWRSGRRHEDHGHRGLRLLRRGGRSGRRRDRRRGGVPGAPARAGGGAPVLGRHDGAAGFVWCGRRDSSRGGGR